MGGKAQVANFCIVGGEEELAVFFFYQEGEPNQIFFEFGMHVGEAFVHEDGVVVCVFQVGKYGTEGNGFRGALGESFGLDLGKVSVGDGLFLAVFETDGVGFRFGVVADDGVSDGRYFRCRILRCFRYEGDDFFYGVVEDGKNF